MSIFVKNSNGDFPLNLAIRDLHYDAVCALADHETRIRKFSPKTGVLEEAVGVFDRDQAPLNKLLTYPYFSSYTPELEAAMKLAKKKGLKGAMSLIQERLDKVGRGERAAILSEI